MSVCCHRLAREGSVTAQGYQENTRITASQFYIAARARLHRRLGNGEAKKPEIAGNGHQQPVGEGSRDPLRSPSVPGAGFEPARAYAHKILSLVVSGRKARGFGYFARARAGA
jgi:hypothetical protein